MLDLNQACISKGSPPLAFACLLCRVDYPKLEVPLSISPPKRIGWTEGADQLLNRYHASAETEAIDMMHLRLFLQGLRICTCNTSFGISMHTESQIIHTHHMTVISCTQKHHSNNTGASATTMAFTLAATRLCRSQCAAWTALHTSRSAISSEVCLVRMYPVSTELS